jgi:hypothetical protein
MPGAAKITITSVSGDHWDMASYLLSRMGCIEERQEEPIA